MKSETSKGPIRGLSDDSLLDDDSSRAPVGIKPSLPSANPILLTLIIGPLTPKQGSRDGLGPASALVRRPPWSVFLEILLVRRPNPLLKRAEGGNPLSALKKFSASAVRIPP